MTATTYNKAEEDFDGLGGFFEIIGRPAPLNPPNKVPQLRLARIVKQGDDPDYIKNKLCYWCRKKPMVHLAWCPRCYFYMIHNFDKAMFISDEGINEWEEYKKF